MRLKFRSWIFENRLKKVDPDLIFKNPSPKFQPLRKRALFLATFFRARPPIFSYKNWMKYFMCKNQRHQRLTCRVVGAYSLHLICSSARYVESKVSAVVVFLFWHSQKNIGNKQFFFRWVKICMGCRFAGQEFRAPGKDFTAFRVKNTQKSGVAPGEDVPSSGSDFPTSRSELLTQNAIWHNQPSKNLNI